VDLIYIDPPFNSNRNYGQRPDWHSLWGETKEKRTFEDRHESTRACIDFIVSFDYSSDAMTEIGNFFKRSGKIIRAFTVRDILDEETGRKLA
jgi:hypothetical protein